MTMIKWIHHLLNPHCEHCMELERDAHICQSCEILKEQLALSHMENQKLLDKIINPPSIPEPQDLGNIEPIKPRVTSWAIRKQMLEAEDRKKNQLMREKNEELEKEIGLNNG